LNNVADLNYTGFFGDVVTGGFLLAMGDVQVWVENAFTDIDARKKLNGDINLEDYDASDTRTVYRLREGIERFFITDINNPAASAMSQSEIAIVHDDTNAKVQGATAMFNHVPGGGNVLYLDGHVAFIRYPGDWPVCATWSNIMANAV
jgi:prepilin-type processing-associated H-X9-DG protein